MPMLDIAGYECSECGGGGADEASRLCLRCARIEELVAHLLVMTEHATNKAGGYLAKDHPDVLRARELTRILS